MARLAAAPHHREAAHQHRHAHSRAPFCALSTCASVVVLDLSAAQLCSVDAAIAIDEAARELEASGGALVCVHADPRSLAHLAAAGSHTVLMPASAP